MGTTDVDGITARVTRAVLAAARPDRIDVVLGAESPSLGAIARLRDAHRELCLHVETTRMASLMAAADLAIGAAGTTSWERCCLGLPSLVVVLAANQQVIADKLDEAGAHRLVSLSPVDTLSDQLVDLLHDDQARRAMARIAAGVTDGRGAARVAAAMMEA
jgi:spore coat polysaccharide biosynthesis predicted glycosyltransferase SpsG